MKDLTYVDTQLLRQLTSAYAKAKDFMAVVRKKHPGEDLYVPELAALELHLIETDEYINANPDFVLEVA